MQLLTGDVAVVQRRMQLGEGFTTLNSSDLLNDASRRTLHTVLESSEYVTLWCIIEPLQWKTILYYAGCIDSNHTEM